MSAATARTARTVDAARRGLAETFRTAGLDSASLDARLLIATDLGTTGFALYLMTGFTPDVSQGTSIRTGLMQGIGIGFVFVPLSTIAFGTLAPALRTQGTGLYNLMRNIGASIGISTMSYLLVRNTAITQAALVEHITPYRQVVRDYAHQLNIVTLSGRAALAQTVTAQAEAGQVILRVRDNGRGIAPDLLPRVFDPFWRGPGRGEKGARGLGLGLALVKSLVELHGAVSRPVATAPAPARNS